MKSWNFFTLLMFLLFTQLSFAQNNFKIGPSALLNVGFFEEVVMPLGIEVGYEIGIREKLSVNLAGMYHYNKRESGFLDSELNQIMRKDTYIGTQVDFRYHFRERYKGPYMGIGTDLKLLNAKNYFPPTLNDPEPTLQDLEFNVGISLGTFITLEKGAINPNLYIGGNPSDQNEYGLHAKLGINYVF